MYGGTYYNRDFRKDEVMNNYCINLKKRKNKPYCNLRKENIELAECRNCSNKEYRTKIEENSFYKQKKSTYNRKNPVISGKNAQSLTKEQQKKIKMHNKSKKLTVTKDTYNCVIERDNYSCRLCGSTNWLQLHHILYRSQRKDLINDVDNCIMLCSDCHRLVHSNKKKWQPLLLEMIKDTRQLV